MSSPCHLFYCCHCLMTRMGVMCDMVSHVIRGRVMGIMSRNQRNPHNNGRWASITHKNSDGQKYFIANVTVRDLLIRRDAWMGVNGGQRDILCVCKLHINKIFGPDTPHVFRTHAPTAIFYINKKVCFICHRMNVAAPAPSLQYAPTIVSTVFI